MSNLLPKDDGTIIRNKAKILNNCIFNVKNLESSIIRKLNTRDISIVTNYFFDVPEKFQTEFGDSMVLKEIKPKEWEWQSSYNHKPVNLLDVLNIRNDYQKQNEGSAFTPLIRNIFNFFRTKQIDKEESFISEFKDVINFEEKKINSQAYLLVIKIERVLTTYLMDKSINKNDYEKIVVFVEKLLADVKKLSNLYTEKAKLEVYITKFIETNDKIDDNMYHEVNVILDYLTKRFHKLEEEIAFYYEKHIKRNAVYKTINLIYSQIEQLIDENDQVKKFDDKYNSVFANILYMIDIIEGEKNLYNLYLEQEKKNNINYDGNDKTELFKAAYSCDDFNINGNYRDNLNKRK